MISWDLQKTHASAKDLETGFNTQLKAAQKPWIQVLKKSNFLFFLKAGFWLSRMDLLQYMVENLESRAKIVEKWMLKGKIFQALEEFRIWK